MTESEKFEYVLNLFRSNKIDMKISTIRGLIPVQMKTDLEDVLEELVKNGYLTYSDQFWSGTEKGRKFNGFRKVANNAHQFNN